MAKDYSFEKKFRDLILRCSNCGFCRAVCPVFALTKRPALNARGKMLILSEVLAGHIDLDEDLIESLFQCTTCANCTENCPAGVDVPEILKTVRRDMVDLGTCHPAFTGMQEVLQSQRNIYGEKDQPDFGKKRNQKAEIVFFIGCVGLYREEEAAAEAVELLDRLGVDFTLIDEACCSGVLEDVGFRINPDLAEKNIEAILKTGAQTLITGCPYCFRTFKNKEAYRKLGDHGIRILHISQFLKDMDVNVATEKVVTYHDPCDLGRHAGIYEEPRETIRKIAPNFVELPHHHGESICCGAGGGVRAAFPANSIAMARRRLEEVEEVGADILLTECNSCVHNLINGRLRRQKFEIFTTTQFISALMKEKASN